MWTGTFWTRATSGKDSRDWSWISVWEAPMATQREMRIAGVYFSLPLFSSYRHIDIGKRAKMGLRSPWVFTSGSDQGLAGGLGEGQDPWLSKLAVLVFHCKRGHMKKQSPRRYRNISRNHFQRYKNAAPRSSEWLDFSLLTLDHRSQCS